MIETIIVDDEEKVGEELRNMLKRNHADVKVSAICSDISETLFALDKFHPALIFLDVELGSGQTGFDLLKKIPQPDFDIIFTTGYNQYAITAIKFSAVDYLLKPIDEDELKASIEKVRTKNYTINSNRIESFLAAWANPGDQKNKMPLPTMTGYDMVSIEDIIYCEGISNQTMLVMNNQKEVIVSKTLKECEDTLSQYGFVRIHKSYLINLNHVKRYVRANDGLAIMSNGANLSVSKSFKQKLTDRLKIPNPFTK